MKISSFRSKWLTRFFQNFILIFILGTLGAVVCGVGQISLYAQTKRLIQIKSSHPAWIELPDGQWRDLTDGLRSRVQTQLIQSGKFTVEFPESIGMMKMQNLDQDNSCGPQAWVWDSVGAVSGGVEFRVKEFSFFTGDRGGRMFYGFDERFRTPFNDGSQIISNEFPLRVIQMIPNWFDKSFDQKGRGVLHSRTGLDLGEGFRFDAWAAYFALNYAKYQSRMMIEATLWQGGNQFDSPQRELIEVSGEGQFFDFSGGYDRYSLGIQVARRTAILQVFEKMSVALAERSAAALERLPLRASLDGWLDNCGVRYYLLGTGLDSSQLEGKIFVLENDFSKKLRVVKTSASGSVAVLEGNWNENDLEKGSLWREYSHNNFENHSDILSLSSPDLVSPSTSPLFSSDPSKTKGEQEPPKISIRLPTQSLERQSLYQVQTPEEKFRAFIRSALETAFLPFRVSRYFQYDQNIQPQAFASREFDWREDSENERPVRIALIDSGVDYNHPSLKGKFWKNEKPVKDLRGEEDTLGWDFISGDGRPFDDGYTGTQMAGLLAEADAPIEMMALKVFNPFGVTSSAAYYGAVDYAVKHGADLIVLGAVTRRESKALKEALRLAEQYGVWIVMPAGDRGFALEQEKVFPAAWSNEFQNFLVVTAMKKNTHDRGSGLDELVDLKGKSANYSSELVDVAVWGESVPVIEPRKGKSIETGTRIAASRAAARLAEFLWKEALLGKSTKDFSLIKQRFLEKETYSSDRLLEKVKGGRTLRE